MCAKVPKVQICPKTFVHDCRFKNTSGYVSKIARLWTSLPDPSGVVLPSPHPVLILLMKLKNPGNEAAVDDRSDVVWRIGDRTDKIKETFAVFVAIIINWRLQYSKCRKPTLCLCWKKSFHNTKWNDSNDSYWRRTILCIFAWGESPGSGIGPQLISHQRILSSYSLSELF